MMSQEEYGSYLASQGFSGDTNQLYTAYVNMYDPLAFAEDNPSPEQVLVYTGGVDPLTEIGGQLHVTENVQVDPNPSIYLSGGSQNDVLPIGGNANLDLISQLSALDMWNSVTDGMGLGTDSLTSFMMAGLSLEALVLLFKAMTSITGVIGALKLLGMSKAVLIGVAAIMAFFIGYALLSTFTSGRGIWWGNTRIGWIDNAGNISGKYRGRNLR